MVKVNTGELKLPGGDLNGRLVGIKSCRKRHGLVAQLAVHLIGNEEVAGSNPAETSRKAIHTLLTLGVQRFGVALRVSGKR